MNQFKKPIWDNHNDYSPPIIAFGGASRRRIWTKIGGNESQDLPGPPYSPQNPQFRPENLKIAQTNLKEHIQNILISLIMALYCTILVIPAIFFFGAPFVYMSAEVCTLVFSIVLQVK